MPNSISDNLQRLQTARSDIATAIINKGGTVGQNDGFEEFVSDISTIPNPVTPTLITKSITSNGTYNASSDNADGYSQVTVDVSAQPTVKQGTITYNTTYATSGNLYSVGADDLYVGIYGSFYINAISSGIINSGNTILTVSGIILPSGTSNTYIIIQYRDSNYNTIWSNTRLQYSNVNDNTFNLNVNGQWTVNQYSNMTVYVYGMIYRK